MIVLWKAKVSKQDSIRLKFRPHSFCLFSDHQANKKVLVETSGLLFP